MSRARQVSQLIGASNNHLVATPATFSNTVAVANTTTNTVFVSSNGHVGIGPYAANTGAMLDVYKKDDSSNIIRASNTAGNYRWRVDQFFDQFHTNSSGTDTISLKGNTGQIIVTGSIAAPNNVVQVVSINSVASVSGSIPGWVDGAFSASITPKYTNSKILVAMTLPNQYTTNGGSDLFLRLLRNGTDVLTAAAANNTARGGSSNFSNILYLGASARHLVVFTYLDSPATTSTVTYTYKMYMDATGTYYNNYPSDRANQNITLTEIYS